MGNLLTKIEETKAYISKQINSRPKVGLILGSGLGTLADEIQNPIVIDYKDIPHFPTSTVEGHAGELVIGELEGKCVVAMKGRFHYYEGYSMQEITFPVRVMKALGVNHLIVTNACGGLNSKLYPGALMIITDHINLTGDNPLIGPNYATLGPRFPDMSSAYSKEWIIQVKNVARELGIEIHEGVYVAISGPNYLSKAELKMVTILGADTVGMSTVPEVIVAAHSGMKILGISCVTDMAIPDHLESISHEQVVEVANRTKPKFICLIKKVLKEVTI